MRRRIISTTVSRGFSVTRGWSSSSKARSKTWCTFSIAQCRRIAGQPLLGGEPVDGEAREKVVRLVGWFADAIEAIRVDANHRP